MPLNSKTLKSDFPSWHHDWPGTLSNTPTRILNCIEGQIWSAQISWGHAGHCLRPGVAALARSQNGVDDRLMVDVPPGSPMKSHMKRVAPEISESGVLNQSVPWGKVSGRLDPQTGLARYSMYLCRVPAYPLHLQPEFQSHIIYTSHERCASNKLLLAGGLCSYLGAGSASPTNNTNIPMDLVCPSMESNSLTLAEFLLVGCCTLDHDSSKPLLNQC